MPLSFTDPPARIQTCGTNDACVCTNSTGAMLLQCEQCLFNHAIAQNIRLPNTLMGSQPALTGQ